MIECCETCRKLDECGGQISDYEWKCEKYVRDIIRYCLLEEEIMGKGDTYRPVDRDKWDRNYLRIFGQECDCCCGSGEVRIIFKGPDPDIAGTCDVCQGLGYVPKESK